MKRYQGKEEQPKTDKPVSRRHLFTNIVNERTSMLVEDNDSLQKILVITKYINTENELADKKKPKFKTYEESVNLQKLNVSEGEKQKLLKKLINNLVTTGSPDDSEPMNNFLFSQLFLAQDIGMKNSLEVNPSILQKKYKIMTEMEDIVEPEFSAQSIQLTDENTSYSLKNGVIKIISVGAALYVGYLMMPAGVLFAAGSGVSSVLTTATAAAATVKTATETAKAAETVLKTAEAAMKLAQIKIDAAKKSGVLEDYNSGIADYEGSRKIYNEQVGIHNEAASSHTSSGTQLAASSAEIAEALLGLPNTFSIMVKVYTVIRSAEQGRDIKESLEIMLKTGAREGIKFGVTYVVGAYTTNPQNAKQLEKLKGYISSKFPTQVGLIDSAGKFIGTNYTKVSTKIGEYFDTSSAFISSSRVGEFVERTAATVSSLLPESVTTTITTAKAPATEAVTWLFGYMKSSAIIYATNTGLDGVMDKIEFLKATNREKQIIKNEQDNLKLMEKQQEFMDFEFEMENGFEPTSRVLKNLYSDMTIKLDNVTKKHPYIATMMILITANYGARWICDTFINNAEGIFRYGAGWLPYGSSSVNDLITIVKDQKLIKTDAVRSQIQRMIFPYLARVVNDILPLKKMIMEQIQTRLNLKADEFITIDKVVKRELTVIMVTKNIVYLLTKISTDIVQEGFIMNTMTLTQVEVDKYINKMEHWYRNYVPKSLQGVIDKSITSASGGMPLRVHSFLTSFSNFFWNSNNPDSVNKAGEDLAAALGKAYGSGANVPGSSGSNSGSSSSNSGSSSSFGSSTSSSFNNVQFSSASNINNEFPDITPETQIKPKKQEPVLGQAPYINIGDISINTVGMTESAIDGITQKDPNISITNAFSQMIGAAEAPVSNTAIDDAQTTEVQNIRSELKQKKEDIEAHILKNDASIRTLIEHINDNEKNLQTQSDFLPTDIKTLIQAEITRLKTLRDSLNTENTAYRDYLQRIESHYSLPALVLSSTSITEYTRLKVWFTGISGNPLYYIPQGPLQFDSTRLPKLFSHGAAHYTAYTALKNASPDPATFRAYSAAVTNKPPFEDEVPFTSIPIDRIKAQTVIFNQHKNFLESIAKMRRDIATLTTEINKHPVPKEDSGVKCGNITCVQLLLEQKNALTNMTNDVNRNEENLRFAVDSNLGALFTGKPLPINLIQFKKIDTDSFSVFKQHIHKNMSISKGVISFVPSSQAQLNKYTELIIWYTELKRDQKAITALQSYLDKNEPTTLNDLFEGLLKNNNPTEPKLTGVAEEVEFDINFDAKLADFKSAIEKMKNFDEQFSKISKNLTDTKTKTDQAHHTATGVHNEVSNIAGDSREQRGKRADTRDILKSAIDQVTAINEKPATLTSTQTSFDAQITALFTDIKAGNSVTPHLETIDTTHGTLTGLEKSITDIGTEVDKLNEKLVIEANKGIFGIQTGLKPETEKPKGAEQVPKEEQKPAEPVTLEGLQLYLRTKTANRLQFFLKNKNMLSEKFKTLLDLLTPEAFKVKEGEEVSIEEQLIIDLAHQDIIDSLTGTDDRHNRAITAILDDFNLPELNIHSLGKILSLGTDAGFSYGVGGLITGIVGGIGTVVTTATGGIGAAGTVAAINHLKAVNELATVYSSTYETMNHYLNLGDGALQEKARKLQLAIQQAQLKAQVVQDGISRIKDDISYAGKNLLHWAQGGIGFVDKDGYLDPILIQEPPLSIVGQFNVPKLLLANAISGGGASVREALFKAYDVKGEGTLLNLYNENWDKVVKMFTIAKDYSLTSPELIPLLFGDKLVNPGEMLNEVQIAKARAGTYFAPTANESIEINKIIRSIMDWDMAKIAEICIGKTIPSKISFLCNQAYEPWKLRARRTSKPWQYDYEGYLAGKYHEPGSNPQYKKI